MKFSKLIPVVLLSMCVCGVANAARPQKLVLGTGAPEKTYNNLGLDIIDYCESSLTENSTIELPPSKGSIDNLTGLFGKRFTHAIVQEDVLRFYAQNEPNKYNSNSVKALLSMHIEPIHLVIPKGYTPSGNSLFSKLGLGGGDAPLNITDLKGQTVGAWGGSVLSAKALSMFLGLNLNVVELPEGTARTRAEIPVFIVGGHPDKSVEYYLSTGEYNLLPLKIDESLLKEEAPFYSKVKVSYKVDGKQKNFDTFGVRALLIGKNYRRDSLNENSSRLATCLDESLIDLNDDFNTSPQWQIIYQLNEEGTQTSWPYFPFYESK